MILAVDSLHNAVYLLLRGTVLLELEKVQQQIGSVLERLHSDKHFLMLALRSDLTSCISLSASCVDAHEPALHLQQAAEQATVCGAELILEGGDDICGAELVLEGGDDHVNLLQQALKRQPVQAPAPVAVVQLFVWVTMRGFSKVVMAW